MTQQPDDPAAADDEPSTTESAPLKNTLYRKVTRGQRKLTRGRLLVYRVAVVVAWWAVRALWASCRITHVAGRETAAAAIRDLQSLIPVYWHQHMLFGARALLDLRSAGLKVGFLVSPSVDGTGPAMLVQKVGAHVIRGSSTHTGARALRDYYETIVKQQISPAITPDGPRGPLHEFKPGAIMLAQITGKPILPIAVAHSRKVTFRTWDSFELPLPFSRVAIVYGEPVKVSRAMDASALAGWQQQMAERLLDLRRQAEAALEQGWKSGYRAPGKKDSLPWLPRDPPLPPVNTRRPKITPATAPPMALPPHELGSTDETIIVLRRAFDELGDLFRIHVPSRGASTWVASHPDDVKRVLVTNHRNYAKGVGIDRVRLLLGNGIMTSEGEFWRRQRRMMQPAFHRRVVEHYASIVREENESLGAEWSAAARSTGRANVTLSVSRLALRVILRALFTDDLRQLVPDLDVNPFVALLQGARRDTRFAYQFRQLARQVKALVSVRRGRQQERLDLLQLLLDARDADTGEAMSDTEVVDEVMTLVVAGHETTASTLNWTWWLLATHAAVSMRVAEEQCAVGELGHASYADLIRLPYMRQVVDESMRLYPPAWLLTRRSIGPDTLGGYAVPPGTDVFISPYLVHRHPRHWRLPDTFDPGHFDPPQVEARHAFAYIPFAAGPRHCIGQNFSLYEILLHFNFAVRRFRLTDPQPVQPPLEARINLRTASDVHMRIQQR